MNRLSLDPIASAFPNRPLPLKAPITRWRGWLSAFVTFILCAGFTAWASIALVPALIDDYALRTTAVPVNGRVSNGECRTRFGLLQACGVTIRPVRRRRGWSRRGRR
jgi:hypothetical protein